MKEDYQKAVTAARKCGAPATVSVVMAELAEDMREGLLALAVGAGLQVMAAVMEQDVTAVCGPKGRHDPGRTAVRHGHEKGSVTLGGRRVPAQRPRIRAVDGGGELAVPAYELFSWTEILGRMALSRMLAGLVLAVPDRVGTGWPEGRTGRDRDEQIGGVAAVRRRETDRPGRVARRAAGRVGPGPS